MKMILRWEAALLDSPWVAQELWKLFTATLFFVGMCALRCVHSPLSHLGPGVCSEEGGTAGQQNIHLGWHKVKEWE